jgi:hypothetical protein
MMTFLHLKKAEGGSCTVGCNDFKKLDIPAPDVKAKVICVPFLPFNALLHQSLQNFLKFPSKLRYQKRKNRSRL